MKTAMVALMMLALASRAYGIAAYSTIIPSVASPGVGGAVVVFTGVATGGSGNYEYKFWRQPVSGGYEGLWSLVRDWSTDATWSYSVPAGGGQQKIGVWMREMGSLAEYEGFGSIFWEALAAPLPSTGNAPSCGPLTLSALGAAYSNPTGQNYLPIGGKAYTGGSFPFPFTVPAGRSYEISSIHFRGKKIMSGDGVVRGGAVVMTNLFTVDADAPLVFPSPLALPAGFVLDGLFHNDTSSEPMNMMVVVVGRLVGGDCPK